MLRNAPREGAPAADVLGDVSPEMEEIFGPRSAAAPPCGPEVAPAPRPRPDLRGWTVRLAGVSAVGLTGLIGGMLLSSAFDDGTPVPQLNLPTERAAPAPAAAGRIGSLLAVAAPAPALRQPADGPVPAEPIAQPDPQPDAPTPARVARLPLAHITRRNAVRVRAICGARCFTQHASGAERRRPASWPYVGEDQTRVAWSASAAGDPLRGLY